MKTSAKPAFAVGDAVTLKGQTVVLTVSPPPANQAVPLVTHEGWVWCAYASQMGLGFHYLPVACLALAKAPTRARG